MDEIPPQFDVAFLDWFRARTERYWSQFTSDIDEGWQPGTRWLDGLSAAEIERTEQQWRVRFPPDYRLFLGHLHALNHPMRVATYEGSRQVTRERPVFYNWLTDTNDLRDMFDWPLDGLLFDLEYNNLWLPGWGVKPDTLAKQQARLRELVAAAPRLIPIFGHRYLVPEPYQAGNPVLSVYQSDIIIYGTDLRRYFLLEFNDWLGIEYEYRDAVPDYPMHGAETIRAEEIIQRLPIWGEVYMWNNHGQLPGGA